MPRLTRSLAVLLLVLLLVPTALHAAGPRQSTAWNVLAWVWSFLQVDNGCEVDPNGRCRATVALDNGCMVDPNGRCNN
jgi:hypothetical protein